MDFSERVITEEIDEILRRAAMRMEQQSIHIHELQAGSESLRAQGRLKQARAMCDRLRAYRARFS
jgi:FKBP-type peptidyl-prolyl cis-trans isomerase (trigger factor)